MATQDVRLTVLADDGNVYPVLGTTKGELKLEEIPDQSFDGNLEGDLTVSGRAEFAGNVRIEGGITAAGSQISEFFGTQSDSTTAFEIRDNSGANYYYTVTTDGSVWIGNKTGTGGNYSTSNNANIQLKADGTAEFAGGVNVGTATSRLGNSWGYQIYGGINANGFALYNSGIHNTPSAPYFLRCVVTGVGDTVFVRTDGSAEFAGNKAGFTAEGHLWCTTRRGDTVILDATSNGLASWVPYTPPSRLTELQDRWAEKDGILPVPHDSSQDEPETPQ